MRMPVSSLTLALRCSSSATFNTRVYSKGNFYEGFMATGVASEATDEAIQANIVAVGCELWRRHFAPPPCATLTLLAWGWLWLQTPVSMCPPTLKLSDQPTLLAVLGSWELLWYGRDDCSIVRR